MYALFDGDKPVKWACKGVDFSPQQIRDTVLSGESATWHNQFPTHRLDGSVTWLSRTIRMTA
jgi:hypothetical protein